MKNPSQITTVTGDLYLEAVRTLDWMAAAYNELLAEHAALCRIPVPGSAALSYAREFIRTAQGRENMNYADLIALTTVDNLESEDDGCS